MSNRSATNFTQQYAEAHDRAVSTTPWDDVAALIAELEQLRERDALLFLAGNGGSASTVSHFGVDFTKGVALEGRRPLRAVSLADSMPVVTAVANDISFDEVFSHPLAHLSRGGDALLVVSGSGRSPNILRAMEAARERGLRTLALLGMGGGPAAALADVHVVVPSDDYGVIEDIHLLIGHAITAYLRTNGAESLQG